MKQKIVLMAAILVGIFAFGLTHRYLQVEREKLYAGAEKIDIIVAKAPLAGGTTLKVEDLKIQPVFKTHVTQQHIRPEELGPALGRRLRNPMRANEPLLWYNVDLPERGRNTLAAMVQPTLRAVSLAIGGDAAVSGLVQPNDRVDILGTFTFPSRKQQGQMETVTLTVLQDVSVLATGQRLAQSELFANAPEGRMSGYSTITFEVTPREAELLVFAQHMKGQLTLTLRNPDDQSFEMNLPEIDFQQLEQSLPDINENRQRAIRHKDF